MGEFTKTIAARTKPTDLPDLPRTLLRLGVASRYVIVAWPHNGHGRHSLPGSGERLRGFEPLLCERVRMQRLPGEAGSFQANRVIPVFDDTGEELASGLLSQWALRQWSNKALTLARNDAERGVTPKFTVWTVTEDLTLSLLAMQANDPRLVVTAERKLAWLNLHDGTMHVVALAPVDVLTKRTGL